MHPAVSDRCIAGIIQRIVKISAGLVNFKLM